MCIYKNAHAKLTKMQTELFTNDITGSWLLVSCITAISTKETTHFTERSGLQSNLMSDFSFYFNFWQAHSAGAFNVFCGD